MQNAGIVNLIYTHTDTEMLVSKWLGLGPKEEDKRNKFNSWLNNVKAIQWRQTDRRNMLKKWRG
jgi:hypothetical protein